MRTLKTECMLKEHTSIKSTQYNDTKFCLSFKSISSDLRNTHCDTLLALLIFILLMFSSCCQDYIKLNVVVIYFDEIITSRFYLDATKGNAMQ